jgi:hypothetical protein
MLSVVPSDFSNIDVIEGGPDSLSHPKWTSFRIAAALQVTLLSWTSGPVFLPRAMLAL